MPEFNYKVRNREGVEQEGTTSAKDRLELARVLRTQGNVVISVSEVKEGGSNFLNRMVSFLNRISLKEKILFAGNLSTMISAGLTLSRSLTIIEKQTKNPKLKKVTNTIMEDVTSGKTFAEALERFPNIFPPIFSAMVRSGQESGNLPKALENVADQFTKSYELRKKIRGAMIYPIIILLLISVIGVLMMVYMVPTLSATFEDLGSELPIQTRFIIGVSDFLVAYIVYVLAGVFVGGLTLWKFLKTSSGRRFSSFTFLHLPIIKNITMQANSALTMRTLSSLIKSGIGVVKSIEITRDIIQNTYYTEALNGAAKEVQKGINLSSILARAEKLYPVLVGEMIQVGEETGKLGEMLEKGAKFYEDEVDDITKNLSTIIEPLLMIIIGIAVGFFAISMIQPLYSLGDLL
tara:strand:- start:602 stop:1819 length:1218 start_codon:yes stop_codon:yes gene_type:complete